MRNAVKKSQATRAANKQRRLAQNDDAANQSVLEQLATLFKNAPMWNQRSALGQQTGNFS